MFKRMVLCMALITCGLVLLLNAQQPAPVQPAPITRTILQRADVPGTNLEFIYATVEIAAGFKAGRHHHPGVVMGQVVEGDFWLHVAGRPEQILRAGESVTLPDRAMHNEGAMDKPVKLNAVYVVEKGQPLASPAPSRVARADEVIEETRGGTQESVMGHGGGGQHRALPAACSASSQLPPASAPPSHGRSDPSTQAHG